MGLANFTPPDAGSPLDWALAYIAAGMPVFPVRADKKPLTEHGVKDATVNETVIRIWWRR
jgi:Bifunctional DNA primase/polymerase, N-terminal